MQEWIQKIFGTAVTPVAAYIILGLVALLALYLLVRIARRLTGGTFVAGGKSRQLRLAIMDATPVDAHRRLVLVRRDDVEHLILIGGPTDVVVEQNIRLSAPRETGKEAPLATTLASGAQTMSPQTRVDTPAPAVPLRPVPVPVQPIAKTYDAKPYTPTPPTPMHPASAPSQPTGSHISSAPALRPIAPVQPIVEKAAPYVPTPVAVAPVINAPAAASVGAASAIVTPAATVTGKPKDEDDAMLVDLSHDIDKATKGDDEEISLADEMEGLLATLDVKNERAS